MDKEAEDLNIDRNKILKAASQDLDQGAVTSDYSLDLNKVSQYLNEALATEIICVLRYRHHQIIAKGLNHIPVAEEFKEHAEQEEEHMLMIANRMNQLGLDPDFNPTTLLERSTTSYGKATNLVDMIKEDLIAERIVISVYRKLILWFADKDPTTRIMLEKILKDEEEHANDLADLLTPPPDR